MNAYNDAIKNVGEETLVLRDFSNCAEKFDNILYLRHKDEIDTHVGIDALPFKYAVVIASILAFN